ncbi:response regulator transcription factor [Puteibacter caeruleilacunae]|nr:response regulator transcription factor [Puteibacter caeruleilacunae]
MSATCQIKILIVEDEILIAEDMAMRIEDMGYEVVDISPSVDEAIEVLEENPVDIILLDINLEGEKTGLDLGKLIMEKYNVPFIFLSSLGNKSVIDQAKLVKPSAYLLKPFNDRQVQIAIEMALENFSNTNDANVTDAAPSKQEPNKVIPVTMGMGDFLFLKKDSRFEKVAFKDILWLEAESNYTYIHTSNGRYMYSSVLKSFETKLPKERFIRVHRSFIVNIDNITGFEGNILLIGDKQVPVSKGCREAIFAHFRVV